MQDEWYASVRERHWWFTFKKWACNDVAPGICTGGKGSGPRGWLDQWVLLVLHRMKGAHQICNFARPKFLQMDLQNLASQMSVPLYSVWSPTCSPFKRLPSTSSPEN